MLYKQSWQSIARAQDRICEIKYRIRMSLSSLRPAEYLQRRFEAQQYKIKVEKQLVSEY